MKNTENMNSETSDLATEESVQLNKLITENTFLKTQLEEYTQGGIKILFSGKANAQRVVRKVKPRTLKEVKSLSLSSEEKTKNLVIEGDNLKTMTTLYQYHGKVDLIIADPPYNTGKDFRYNDKWDQDPNDEGLGEYVKENDPSKHTKWMKFMLPRLQLMRQMLKPSGALAICIDERELFRLGQMLDEVFGEENRITIINWQKAYGMKPTLHVSSATEYVLVYAKKIENVSTGTLERTEKQRGRFTNADNDPKGDWVADNSLIRAPTRNGVYAIQNPFSGKLYYPAIGTKWRYTKPSMKPLLEEWGSEYEEKELNDGCVPSLVLKGFNLTNLKTPKKDKIFQKACQKAQKIYEKKPWPRLIYLKGGFGKIQFKSYFSEVSQGIKPLTWWGAEDYDWGLGVSWPHQISGHSQAATAELKNIAAPKDKYIGVKPLKLFTKIIQLWCPRNGLILDPFAGSGTTGHAVLQLNKETNTKRNFILIEQGNPENEDNYCRTLLRSRLQSAITGKWADKKEHEPLNGSFTFYTLNKTIDAQTLLEMKRDDLIDAILASQIENHWTKLEGYQYLFARTPANTGVFLIWNGNNKSQLTEEIYYQIIQEARQINLSENYIIYARLCSFRAENLEFEQIPTKILQNFQINE